MSEQHWSVEVDTAPATEPITLTEAKAHCRVDDDADDDYLTELIKVARRHVERRVGPLITQVLILNLDHFPGWEIQMPQGKVQTVDSINYLDTAGASAAFTQFRLDKASMFARLTPNYGYQWPSTYPVTNAIQIEYTAGYGAAAAVPSNIKHAIKLLVGSWYENREQVITGTIVAELPRAVDALLATERASWV